MSTRRMVRNKPIEDQIRYRRLWAMVEGAVVDAFNSHPEYFTERGRVSCAGSICKRVVGQINGFVEQSAKGRKPETPDTER